MLLSFCEPFDQDHVVYALPDRMHVVRDISFLAFVSISGSLWSFRVGLVRPNFNPTQFYILKIKTVNFLYDQSM
jgi:hypothetical protein